MSENDSPGLPKQKAFAWKNEQKTPNQEVKDHCQLAMRSSNHFTSFLAFFIEFHSTLADCIYNRAKHDTARQRVRFPKDSTPKSCWFI